MAAGEVPTDEREKRDRGLWLPQGLRGRIGKNHGGRVLWLGGGRDALPAAAAGVAFAGAPLCCFGISDSAAASTCVGRGGASRSVNGLTGH